MQVLEPLGPSHNPHGSDTVSITIRNTVEHYFYAEFKFRGFPCLRHFAESIFRGQGCDEKKNSGNSSSLP
jgi:hypothetical protein